MSVISAVEQLAGPIGEEVGASNDQVQANFLNAFAKMLESNCGSPDAIERQLCFIESKLNSSARRVIESLAEFVKLSEVRS